MNRMTSLSTSNRPQNKRRGGIVLLLFLCCQVLFGQYELQVKNQSAEALIQRLEKQLSLTFNYNHDNLPLGRFTFSCTGTKAEILQISFSVLDRALVQLDDQVYTLQATKFPPETKEKALSLDGQVLDAQGIPLTGVVIWMPKLEKAFDTDGAGNFRIKGYFAPQEIVEFRYLGYFSQVRTIAALQALTHPKIILKEQQHLLGEIVVTDNGRFDGSSLVALEEVLLPNEMMPLAGRVDKDVFSMVQMLPGLYSADESVSEIQTRGGPPDQTNFEWNGIQVYQTSHFYGKISSVNPFAVDRVNVVKNGASAQSTGQASGTIRMQDQDHTRDSFQLRTQANLLFTNVGLNLPLFKQKVQLRFSWRKSYDLFTDNVLFKRFFDNSFQFGQLSDEAYYRDFYDLQELISLTPKVSFQDFFSSLKIQLSPRDLLKISAVQIENQFELVKSGPVLETSPTHTIQYQNQGYAVHYGRRWNDQFRSDFNWSNSRFKNQYQYLEDPRADSLATTNEQLQLNDLNQTSWAFTQTYEIEQLKLSAGVKYESWEYELSEFGRAGDDKSVYYDDGLRSHERSAFVQALWKASNCWQLEGGLRYSDYSLGQFDYWEPRFHLSVFASEGLTLHAHLGWYHQALNKKNLFNAFHVDNGFWYLSNESEYGSYVHVVENNQFSLGAKYELKTWAFALDIYHKKSDDLWTSAFDFDVHADPYQFADLKVNGLEFSLRYQAKWFSLFWTYDRVEESLTYEDGRVTNSPFSQPNRISLFQALQWKRWQLAIHWKFASGRYFSQPTDLQYNGGNSYSVIYDGLLTEQLPDYHSLDCSLFYQFGRSTGWMRGKVGCSVSNIYNRRNIIKNEYFVDYRPEQIQISLHPWMGLPLVPNFLVELNF
ncbi:MAG: TonB-dependent receptor [Saprospiraceae bacterium]